MADFVERTIEQLGYFGVALLMLVENVFPPIPSELVMPLAGYQAAQGNGQIVLVTLAGSLGSLAGALLWYYAGRALGLERLERLAARRGRWLTLSPEEIRRAQAWYERHGGKSVLIGRLVPGIRTLVSVPAGIVCMPLGRFLLLSGIGTVLWTAALAAAGFLLGERYDVVERWVGPVGNVVFGGLVVWYLYRVITFGRRQTVRA